MGFDDLLGSSNISASGMAAERMRMEVIANNVANARTTRGPNGGAYRRQDVIFETVLQDQLGSGERPGSTYGGVRVVSVQDDMSELPRVQDPGHPDADADGWVTMPNVSLPIEMVNLMTATRAYEANLKVLQTLRQLRQQSLNLLKN